MACIAWAADTRYLQGLGDVRYHRLDSAEAGHVYHVYVMLPDGYRAAGKDYPTVYLLDGGRISSALSHNRCAAGSGEFLVQQVGRLGLSIDQAVERSFDEMRYWLDLEAGYQYEERESNLPGFDYEENQLFLNAMMRF